jgi:hypothetical protein
MNRNIKYQESGANDYKKRRDRGISKSIFLKKL